MKSRKGFTLIELMVVILIVAILAAVAIPLMRGRIDAAKWSEGKSIMGTIGTAIRAYAAEKGSAANANYGANAPTMIQLGFDATDFDGTYFSSANFSWTTGYDINNAPPLEFTITGTAGGGIQTPTVVTLDHLGEWVETP
ncbi:MAG: prepilin-type N-terminal cleavage/methylation domain-containing protein [Sedimentisphaerales bacterium]|nr:prepilin-type N-terminal cleavage/methylation domain-containing protein [Sedimentisphaerales bacterium]